MFKDIKRDLNNIPLEIEKWKGIDRIWQKKRLEIIYKNLVGNSFLEIGCGIGEIIGKVQKIKDGSFCFGIDISKEAIKSAKQLFPKVKFICGDTLNYNFGRKFDTVLAPEILEHMDEPKNLLKAIKKVARKRVIITVPNKNKIDNPDHKQIYNHERLEKHILKNLYPKEIRIIPVARDSMLRTNKFSRVFLGRLTYYLNLDKFFKLKADYDNALFLVAVIDL